MLTPAQRFARLTTALAVCEPRLWPLHRALFRRYFDRLAPRWRHGELGALAAALERVPPPRRALDVGTGTGAAAFLVAGRFPDAEVLGVDLSPRMLEAARARSDGRVRFVEGDASALPFPDGAFDLATLSNMIPFVDELSRVLAAAACVVISFSEGPLTPIWVEPSRLRAELGRCGFTELEEIAAGEATALVAARFQRCASRARPRSSSSQSASESAPSGH